MTDKILLLLIFLLFFGAGASADVVYKWTDANGEVHFSDRPRNGSEAIDLPVEPRYPSAQGQEPPSDARGESEQEESAAEDRGQQQIADAEKQKEIRRKNCATARQTLERNKTLGRMYRVGPDGERHYLSDKERKHVLDRSRADVDKWCD